MHYLVTVPGPEGSGAYQIFQRVFSLGFSGVDLFFVLSGFFIGGILLDHRDSPQLLRSFYLRRGLRIVPLYLVLLASFFVAREIPSLAAVNRGTYFASPIPDWSYFTFLQNIQMARLRDIGPYWLGPTWSLSVEEQFYLLLPLALLRLNRRQLVVICLVVIVASPLVRITALLHAQNNAAAVFLLPARADGLSWGVLCAAGIRHAGTVAWLQAHRRCLAWLLGLLGLVLVGFTWGRFAADSVAVVCFGYSVLSIFYALAVIHVACRSWADSPSFLAARPLAAVGLTSYFTYLFHTPVWYAMHWLCFNRPPLHFSWAAGAVTFASLAVTLLLAWASWRWFEGPLLRFGRRFSYA